MTTTLTHAQSGYDTNDRQPNETDWYLDVNYWFLKVDDDGVIGFRQYNVEKLQIITYFQQ